MEQTNSIFMTPAAIATLANEQALSDLELLLFTLNVWIANPPPLYIACTETVRNWLVEAQRTYPAQIHMRVCLEPYKNLSRKDMESLPSRNGRSNLFHDFTEEKCGLLEAALKSLSEGQRKKGVLFCDADILWLGQLPQIPKGATLALSRHGIRSYDEDRFGMYNAGFLWTNDISMPSKWRKACETSRFFEQAALEDLAKQAPSETFYTFGPEFNYGWWRMFQSPTSIQKQQAEWSIRRHPQEEHSGVLVSGQPLSCIHTHWKTTDAVTQEFNSWIAGKLRLLKSQNRVRHLAGKLGIR